MDFKEELQLLSNHIRDNQKFVTNEAAAKLSFVQPFIKALGYNVADPQEVKPECPCRIGVGDVKVDYGLISDGQIRMIIECKSPGEDLKSVNHTKQLSAYFMLMPDVRFGVLTNGIVYHFYSDIDKPPSMDGKPFLELSMLDIHESQISWLERFTKKSFNIDAIIIAVSELKYMRNIKRILVEEFDKPSKDFVSIFAKKLYLSGNINKPVLDQFTDRVKSACSEFITERINEVLNPDPWNPDRTKATWDLLPPYPSKEFMDYLKASGMTLEHFKTLPVYVHGIKHGIIKEPHGKPNGGGSLEFFRQLLQKSNRLTQLFANVSPGSGHAITAGGGKQGLGFDYVIRKNKARVQFAFWHSDPQLNGRRFEQVEAKKDVIEAAFGERLEWDAKEEQKQRYIRSTSSIGGLEDKEKWPQIQDDLADRMVRLEKALRSHLAALV
jgi:hypothetical protein